MSSTLGMDGLHKFVIDDGNANYFREQVENPVSPFHGGFNASEVVTGLGNPFSRKILPRGEWDDHIRRQESEQSSPDHWRLSGKVPVMDQSSWGYCWMYGTAGAINTSYAMQGITDLRLNPWYTAFMGKNGRNQGGWAGEAIEYINKWGIPTEAVWPERVKDRSLVGKHEVELDAKLHDIVDYEELPQHNFDALVSALLDPERPTPVTLGLQWWGHLIYAVKAVKISNGQYGVKIVNSWKISWGEQGCSVLAESKAKAFEQIAVIGVKPRVAV